MTKKWNTLLTLLNTFSKVSFSNNIKKLEKLLFKCYNENAVLVCKIIIYTRTYNINSQDICDKAEYLINQKLKPIYNPNIEIKSILYLFKSGGYVNHSKNGVIKMCQHLVNKDIIIRQKITPIDLEEATNGFYEYITKHFPDITDANDYNKQISLILDSLYTAYELSLNNLSEILKENKTLILYNNTISQNNKAAILATQIVKYTETDIIKFNSNTASYIFVNKNDNMFNLTNNIRNSKMDCNTIQSAWDLATLYKQDYKRVFILNDDTASKNTTVSSYLPYLKDLGNPYVYHVNLAQNKPSINNNKDKIKHLFGFTSAIYNEIIPFEFDASKHWNKINKINYNLTY